MKKRVLSSLLALTIAISVTGYWQWTWITSIVSTTQIQAITTVVNPPGEAVPDEATRQMLDEGAATVDTDTPGAGRVLSLSR